MVSLDEMRCSWATRVPEPCTRVTRPSPASSRSARLTVMRLMPNCCISADSLGTGSPGRHSPLPMCCLMKAFTCS